MTRSERHPERTRKGILEAAGRLFVLRGFDGAGFREIARKARVSLRMPNHHFGSKVQLFAACVRYALDEKLDFPGMFADPPVFADAREARERLAGKIREVFTMIHPLSGKQVWYGKILALAMHVHTAESTAAMVAGFTAANQWFVAAVKAAAPGVTETFCFFWRCSLWSQISFYSSARLSILATRGMRRYDRAFLADAADHIAHVMLAQLEGQVARRHLPPGPSGVLEEASSSVSPSKAEKQTKRKGQRK